MKDSGPANLPFALPSGIDASKVRQLLMPVEDWFLIVLHSGQVWAWGQNAPSYRRACERYESELATAMSIEGSEGEQVARIRMFYQRLRATVREPKEVASLAGQVVTRIVCAWDSALALTDKGQVYLLTNKEGWETASLQAFSVNYPAKAIAAGRFHFIVLLRNGRVCSWGRGLAMGHGESVSLSQSSPKIIKAFHRHKVVQIAAGDLHSMFLTSEGLLFACGLNFYGQLCLVHARSGDHKGVPTLVDTNALYVEKTKEGGTLSRPSSGWGGREGAPPVWESVPRKIRVKTIHAEGDRSIVVFDDDTIVETMPTEGAQQVPSLL